MVDGTMRDAELSADVPDIRYIEMGFDNYNAREVIINGVNVGEFHLNFNCMSQVDSINYIQSKVTAEVSLIDPDNVLKLDFNIYIKVDPNSMDGMMMGDILNQMDNEISEKGK